jgi:putative oxidoreductase
MNDAVIRPCKMFRNTASSLQSPLLLLVRLYWGWQFAQTGWGKLQHLSHVTGFFVQLGIPLPHATAVFIALLEFCGGILMAVGLASRPIAFALAFDMIVAYVLADRHALASFFSDPGTFYGADPFTFLAASLVVLAFGPGYFALDRFLESKFLSVRRPEQPKQ